MDKQLLQLKREIRELIRLDFIVPEDIPAIELYVDQVTRFMDQQLSGNKRSEEDKILTKTMINNYTKNRLIPPPDRKRYSKEHIILLIYIYYLKNVLPIGDIQRLLEPMTMEMFDEKKMSEIYESIYELEKPQYFNIEASASKAAALVEKKFPKDQDSYLNKVAFIYLLGYDMFSKKRLIEKLIDELPAYDPKLMEAERKKAEKGRKATTRKKAAGKAGARKAAVRKTAAGKKPAKAAGKAAGTAKSPARTPGTAKSPARTPGTAKSPARTTGTAKSPAGAAGTGTGTAGAAGRKTETEDKE